MGISTVLKKATRAPTKNVTTEQGMTMQEQKWHMRDIRDRQKQLMRDQKQKMRDMQRR